jgi:hypothetical protein
LAGALFSGVDDSPNPLGCPELNDLEDIEDEDVDGELL